MLEICAAAVVVLCVIVIAYLLLSSRTVKYEKKRQGSNTSLLITAGQNLSKVSVLAKFDNEHINFERKRIRKGQTVEFIYPFSQQPAKLTVQAESGKTQVFEV